MATIDGRMMRWLWTGMAVILAAGGCARAAQPVSEPPVAASSAPAGPPWHSVAGGAPVITGYELDKDGPRGASNGRDDETVFTRNWAYRSAAGEYMSINITINRDSSGPSESYEYGERVTRSAPHLLMMPLDGVGERGFVVTVREDLTEPRTVLSADALSGNADVTAKIVVPGPLRDEAGVTAHSPTLVRILTEAIASLRPR